jgi:hypothetical protein
MNFQFFYRNREICNKTRLLLFTLTGDCIQEIKRIEHYFFFPHNSLSHHQIHRNNTRSIFYFVSFAVRHPSYLNHRLTTHFSPPPFSIPNPPLILMLIHLTLPRDTLCTDTHRTIPKYSNPAGFPNSSHSSSQNRFIPLLPERIVCKLNTKREGE